MKCVFCDGALMSQKFSRQIEKLNDHETQQNSDESEVLQANWKLNDHETQQNSDESEVLQAGWKT